MDATAQELIARLRRNPDDTDAFASLRAAWSIPVGAKVTVGAPDLALAAKARAGVKLGASGRLDADVKDYGGAPPDVDVKAKAKVKVGVKVPDVKVKAPSVDVKAKVGAAAGGAANAAAGAGAAVKGGVNASVKIKAPEVKVKAPEAKGEVKAKGKIKIGL